MSFFAKLDIIDKLIGLDAPVDSRLRAYITLSLPKESNRNLALALTKAAVRLDAFGHGWHTPVPEYVDGPGSPSLEVSVGQIIDRFDIAVFLQDTVENGRGAVSAKDLFPNITE